MMKSTIASRIGALAVIVIGILFVVLAPAGEAVSSYRQLGAVVMVIGIYWLLRQRRNVVDSEQDGEFVRQQLHWYQSPVVWMPVIVIILIILIQLWR